MDKLLVFFRKAELLLFLTGALSFMAVWGYAPAVAEARNISRPVYLEELENYRFSFEQYKILQERRQREELLEKALIRHQIKPGETLSTIANIYRTSVQALAYWNNISNPHFIRAGRFLDIITVEGSLHHVRKGDTLERIALEYNVEPAAIASFNLLDEKRMFTGQKLVIPGGAHPGEKEFAPVTLLASRSDRRMPDGISFIPAFVWPVDGMVTSYFGMRDGLFHFGLDIGAPYGKKLRAAADGIVEYSGIKTGYGRMLIVDHGRGWRTLYAHNVKNLVSEGDYVSTGQPIAKVGASGNATGPHVHLEIIFGNRKLDPLLFLP
jgi:murein DD-endopeptidase MepM/ murein hydrolase activator NlpD